MKKLWQRIKCFLGLHKWGKEVVIELCGFTRAYGPYCKHCHTPKRPSRLQFQAHSQDSKPSSFLHQRPYGTASKGTEDSSRYFLPDGLPYKDSEPKQ